MRYITQENVKIHANDDLRYWIVPWVVEMRNDYNSKINKLKRIYKFCKVSKKLTLRNDIAYYAEIVKQLETDYPEEFI